MSVHELFLFSLLLSGPLAHFDPDYSGKQAPSFAAHYQQSDEW